jgi:cohesin complex subunit SA-1/2
MVCTRLPRLAISQFDHSIAEIFGSGDSSDEVATQWYSRYQANDSLAVTELVNCILLCAGCDQQVTEDDIRDPDNSHRRLDDLQNMYQEVSFTHISVAIDIGADFTQQQITDYPLISKSKSAKSFRELLTNFFKSLVSLIHETEVLYKDGTLMENIHTWVAPMSSSTLRPFRHTASTIALSVQTGLVDVAKILDNRITNIEAQLAAAKKGKNKAKVNEIQRNLDEANQNRETCTNIITDFFDAVFVHRYRDVDPKIRTECVEALGSWIWMLPNHFNQAEYLRYLGWMLSDTIHTTRHEVLKQLARIFKRDAQGLGHFIDRFRPRLIEIATKDADASVRVAAIAVIDTLRASGMLEPDEIDSIGKLVYDSDLRIRKAVVNFFAACVQDSIDSKIDALGGNDTIEEVFGDDDDGDAETPRKEWINIKCLAENLAAYDAQLVEDRAEELPHGLDVAADVVNATVPETRVSLASQVLYDKMTEVKNWEMLAGYLLFDHTTSTMAKSKRKSKTNPTEMSVRIAVAPQGTEESILLEVLASAVKSNLAHAAEVEKNKKKAARAEVIEEQEESAVALATVIPRLLNKFGAEPETATIVLRMEHYLDLDVFQQLRQDSSQYEKLLDEISTQFNRHNDKRVLAEAAAALLHARQYEELEEMADSRLSVLWENAVDTLRNFDKSCELSVRGNLDEGALRELSTVLMKISKLAKISDCLDVLEAEGRSAESSASVIEILVDIIRRGKFEQEDVELDDLEDEATSFAIAGAMFYFMWRVKRIRGLVQSGSDIPDADLDNLMVLRNKALRNLTSTFSSRIAIDEIRLFAAGCLCDLFVAFATVRSIVSRFGGVAVASSRVGAKLTRFAAEIEPAIVPELISVFDGAERAYAKKARKTLNDPDEDDDPLNDLPEDDEEDDEDLTKEQQSEAELKAEKALCDLAGKYVVAIIAKVVDQSGPLRGKLRKRLLRNQTKLGPNFKEIVSYLDDKKAEALRHKGKKAPAKHKEPTKDTPVAPEEIVIDDPFEEDELEEGSREDLRQRELLDEEEPVEDDDEEEQPNNDDADEDDVLGD